MIELLVLTGPDDPALARLAEVPPSVRVRLAHDAGAATAAAPEADVVLLLSGVGPLLAAAWPRLSRARWVHSRSTGVEHVLALTRGLEGRTVTLTNSRGVFGPALGEFVVAAVLFFAKDLRRMLRSQAQGRWDPFEVERVEGRTAGVIGFGGVGRAVATRLRSLGVRVTALRRQAAPDPDADEVVGPHALGELMAASDYVVVATPLTGDTRGLVDAAALARMKRSAVLVNVGRGAVVDEPALVDALRTGAIRGAALDVFAEEPLPAGHPFYGLDNVLLSPHCADGVSGWQREAMEPFLENLRRFEAGQPLLHAVDPRRGY